MKQTTYLSDFGSVFSNEELVEFFENRHFKTIVVLF
jgi:hypothetical protein